MIHFPPATLGGKQIPLHGYATHQQLLLHELLDISAAAETNPVFMETGCGYYSTLLLYEVAVGLGGRVVSYVEDMDWAKQFLHLDPEVYSQVQVDFNKQLPHMEADLVFMDHERQPKHRAVKIPELLEMAPRIVIHDSDWMDLSPYRHVSDTRLKPNTAVVYR